MGAKPKRFRHIVFVYNSMNDPLFKGNLLKILEFIHGTRGSLFFIVTFEQKAFYLSPAQKTELRASLRAQGMYWFPLTWHTAPGVFKVLVKLYDLAIGFLLVAWLRFRFGCRSIIGLSTVAGAFAFICAKVLGLRFYGYQYEPHSAFMLDFKLWSANSPSYKLLRWFERWSAQGARVLSTATDAWVAELSAIAKGKVFKLPSCIDTEQFQFKAESRYELRLKYGVTHEKVIVYLGKFGGIYYSSEVFELFKALYTARSGLKFWVLTGDPQEELRRAFLSAGIPEKDFHIGRVSFEQVPAYLSAADLGIVTVPGLPSQRFRSPIKVGEYLCCGLPYLVCEGVSEDDYTAQRYDVGVVVRDFSAAEAVRVVPDIERLWQTDATELRERCRKAGLAYRGFSTWAPKMTQIFDALEGAAPPAPAAAPVLGKP